jgi:hypothetical protein
VTPADIVRAFRIAREVTGADARWEVIERLDGADRAAQLELMGGLDALVEGTTRWYLTWEPEGDIEQTIATGREGFERLAAIIGELGTDEHRRRRDATVERLVPMGVGAAGARHAVRPDLVHAPDMVTVAGATGRPIEEVARLLLGRRELRLDWMQAELERIPATSRMQRWALQAVREDAFQVRRSSPAPCWPRPTATSGASSSARIASSACRHSCARWPARATRTSPGSRWRAAAALDRRLGSSPGAFRGSTPRAEPFVQIVKSRCRMPNGSGVDLSLLTFVVMAGGTAAALLRAVLRREDRWAWLLLGLALATTPIGGLVRLAGAGVPLARRRVLPLLLPARVRRRLPARAGAAAADRRLAGSTARSARSARARSSPSCWWTRSLPGRAATGRCSSRSPIRSATSSR